MSLRNRSRACQSWVFPGISNFKQPANCKGGSSIPTTHSSQRMGKMCPPVDCHCYRPQLRQKANRCRVKTCEETFGLKLWFWFWFSTSLSSSLLKWGHHYKPCNQSTRWPAVATFNAHILSPATLWCRVSRGVPKLATCSRELRLQFQERQPDFLIIFLDIFSY